ncbi:Multimeric flavodoxin WrbA [Natronincola peptidivorans]|uniref:Multimeric flavodoxin WrbA n=1 Tax=Natronincola peptidivorans TaxID=426128 RepID=A0A1I0FTN3_9FIRM|nr:flavodoxin family protein [Natronincola peptidivorans]SET60928.1 Multimeric flavodoxin WrbA [Natronincola peptidivorans]
MKVVAFNGSPRKDGNTEILIKHAFKKLEEEGIQCELVNLAGQTIRGCTACMQCRKNLDKRCVIETDIVNDCIEKMLEADGIIIGSPTYFATLTAEAKALIDRAGYVAKGNNNLLKRKVGAAVVSVRRAGALNVFQAINNFYLINEMIIPGSIYWNMGIGKDIGDVESDEEGFLTMEKLGENMAWLLKKIKA